MDPSSLLALDFLSIFSTDDPNLVFLILLSDFFYILWVNFVLRGTFALVSMFEVFKLELCYLRMSLMLSRDLSLLFLSILSLDFFLFMYKPMFSLLSSFSLDILGFRFSLMWVISVDPLQEFFVKKLSINISAVLSFLLTG